MLAKIRVGNLEVHLEAEDMKGIIAQAAFLTQLPTECPKCGEKVSFFHRVAKGYHFYGLRCEGTPVHEANFGQHLDGGSLFYKNDWVIAQIQGSGHSDEDTYHTPPPQSGQKGGSTAPKAPGGAPGGGAAKPPVEVGHCSVCQAELKPAQVTFSTAKFGVPLCITHQKEAAATAPQPPVGSFVPGGVKPPPSADPGLRIATPEERLQVVQWLDYNLQNGIIEGPEADQLRDELQHPQTTIGRVTAIYEDMQARYQAAGAGAGG
jgi:hypothetical protein